MKKIFGLLLAVAILASASACTRVEPGYVGVKVNYVGDDRGVQDRPVVTGWTFYNVFTEKVFEYPTFVQTAVWTASKDEGSESNEEITFNTSEGMTIKCDISLAYQLDASKVPAFYVKFRNDDLRSFTHGYLRNIARDSFNEAGAHFTAEEVYSGKKEVLRQKVQDRINKEVNAYGVGLTQFGFVGAFRSPITAAMDAKAQAAANAITKENELRGVEIEAKKAIAKAEGEAKANQILANSLSSSLVAYKGLEVQEQLIKKWNGAGSIVPQVVTDGRGQLMLNLNK